MLKYLKNYLNSPKPRCTLYTVQFDLNTTDTLFMYLDQLKVSRLLLKIGNCHLCMEGSLEITYTVPLISCKYLPQINSIIIFRILWDHCTQNLFISLTMVRYISHINFLHRPPHSIIKNYIFLIHHKVFNCLNVNLLAPEPCVDKMSTKCHQVSFINWRVKNEKNLLYKVNTTLST